MSYYVDEYYKVQNSVNKGVLYERFFKDLKGKILDVGCSIGNFISNDSKKIIGIDIDEKAIEICRKRCFKAYVMEAEEKLKFRPKTFDAIYCNHVMEHIKDPEKFLKNLKRVLNEKGFIFIRTVDIRRIKFDFWKDYTHKIPYTLKSLEMLLKNAGFKKVLVRRDFRPIRGAGVLLNKKIIRPRDIIRLQNILDKFHIFAKDGIIAIGYK